MSGAALSFEMIAKIIAVMFQTNECAGPISEVYYNLRRTGRPVRYAAILQMLQVPREII